MDRKTEGLIKKRLKDGWIRSSMMIEVLAATKEAAESSLKKHIESLEKEKIAFVYKKDFKDVRESSHPYDRSKKAYSNLVEVELLTPKFESLLVIVMNYGPSSVEILEPETIELNIGEAQGILNSVSEVLHTFAARGVGGVLVKA
jgi:hypothetical protein